MKNLGYEKYQKALEDLEEIEGVKTAVIAEIDGSPLPQSTDRRELVIAGAATFVVAKIAHRIEAGNGNPEEVVIQSKEARIIVFAVGSEHLLIVTTTPEANQNLISSEIKRAVEIIENGGE